MIMTTSEHFDTIADSLADAAENHWNALDALPADSDQREAATDLAYTYDRLSDRWMAGMPLDDESDLELVLDALRASEAVCRVLGLDSDSYEAARLHLEG